MNTVTVQASKNYEIKIGSNLLCTIGSEIQRLGGAETVVIVSDSNVFPLYGSVTESILRASGFTVFSYVFPAGEESKNPGTYLSLVNFLAQNRLTRSDIIIALGGGVVGDLAGFASATYLRGIRFVQIPTTLLAAVDSSVGGKTAIDLPEGKNLLGAFHQPSLVVCDIDTLDSLPEDIFRDGCAEVIKYGILYDSKLFDYLLQAGPSFDRETVITRCVELKRDVVAEDEFDTGARMKLNLGHTLGHGVESCSDFSLSHGKAVAIGMAMVARACGCSDTHKILHALEVFGLPTNAPYSQEEIYQFTLSDKKRAGSSIRLILPRRIGHCETVNYPIENLRSFIQAGL